MSGDDDDDDDECPNCGGLGIVPSCFEDFCAGADCDPEDAETCCMPRRCDWCRPRRPNTETERAAP